MTRWGGALVVAALAGVACGSSGKPGAGPGSAGAGGAAGGGGAGAGAAAGGDAGADASADGALDLATDFGVNATDVAVHCPVAAGALAAPAAALTIEDYIGDGKLDGRIRSNGVFTVKEQFDATAGASFDPAPAIEMACGASGPGAARIRGRAADTGATYAIVFSTSVEGGKPLDHYDASGTTGVGFRVALGDAGASKLLTLQVNLAGSTWDYTKDVTITGTTWQTVTIPWSDLQAAPGAPAFTAATLNQLVFPFLPDSTVDVYLDDVAFTP